MTIFEKYAAYLKDNPEGYWFKAKVYGWGWTPANRAGFAVTGLFVLLVLIIALRVPVDASAEVVIREVVLPIIVASLIFILIAWRTGEKPRWQWHIPDTKKPEETTDL